jgi:uncharacterized protein YprB with RNaseH-like and TPR domain
MSATDFRREIVKMGQFRCKHGHTGLSHYNCYRKESGIPERIGYLDIECSNLKANFGIMLSYCIKVRDKNKIYKSVITKEELENGKLDKELVKRCINDMKNFDHLMGHYSSGYDIPFIRTRALYWGLKFPEYGEMLHTDVYYLARRVLCLHSNRQDVIAETILGHTEKTRLNSRHWIMALQGDKKALAYVLKHNIGDVIDLEKNHKKLEVFARKSNRSM